MNSRRPAPGAWHVLVTISAINFVNAGFPPYVGSALGPFMAADLNLGRREYGLIFSSFLLMSGLLGPAVAAAIRRWGVRYTLAAGSTLICAGSSALAFAVHSALGAVFSYGVLIGAGAGIGGMLVSQTVVTRWFVRRRALALSLVLSAMALGGVVAAPIVSWLALLGENGWRHGWALLAVLSATTTLLALTRITEWPHTPNTAEETPPARRVASEAEEIPTSEWTLRMVLGSMSIWPVLAGAIGFSCAMSFVMAHGPVHIRDIGFSAATVSAWLAVLTAGQLAGTLGAGILGDRTSPRLVWAANLLLLTLGLMLVRHPAAQGTLLLSGMLLGIGIGGSMTGVMSIPAKYYGTSVYPSLIGIITPLLTISGAFASYAGGTTFDRTGSYALAFNAITVLAATSGMLLLAIRPPQKSRWTMNG